VVVPEDNKSKETYRDLAAFKKENPRTGYSFGYAIYDIEEGRVPEDCEAWYPSIEDALDDYRELCYEERER
jgi:hypothetical protein